MNHKDKAPDPIYLHGSKPPRMPKLEPHQTTEQWEAELLARVLAKKSKSKSTENDCTESVQPLKPA